MAVSALDDFFAAISEANCARVERILGDVEGESGQMQLLWHSHPEKRHTALQWAIARAAPARLVEMLLAAGAYMETSLDEGDCDESPLWMAVAQSSPKEVLQLLLDYKADVYVCHVVDATEHDEKAPVRPNETLSILHFAVSRATTPEYAIRMLIEAGGRLLLNDQRNARHETPLIYLTRRSMSLDMIRLLLDAGADLECVDGGGRSAYSYAAEALDPDLALLMEAAGVERLVYAMRDDDSYSKRTDSCARRTINSSLTGIDRPSILAALHTFHRKDTLRLEILYHRRTEDAVESDWFDFWGGHVSHGGKDALELPVDGIWQWMGEWRETGGRGTEWQDRAAGHPPHRVYLAQLPHPDDSCARWMRLRQRLAVNEPVYLRDAVRVVDAAETARHANRQQLTPHIFRLYQEAVEGLLTGLGHEGDAHRKALTAPYLQRLMQHVETLRQTAESDEIRSLMLVQNNSVSSLRPINSPVAIHTVTVPVENHAHDSSNPSSPSANNRDTSVVPMAMAMDHGNSKDNISNNNNNNNNNGSGLWRRISRLSRVFHPARSRETLAAESDGDVSDTDSLRYCPACSQRLTEDGTRASHLMACLQSTRVVGDRYSVSSFTQSPRLDGDRQLRDAMMEECPICYEEFLTGDRVAVLNCLCRFHETCIADWFARGKQCPYHGRHIE